MMSSRGNDCYQPGLSMPWPSSDNSGNVMPSMEFSRRNSMQHVPFMDFSFFPVREDPLAAANSVTPKPPSANSAMGNLLSMPSSFVQHNVNDNVNNGQQQQYQQNQYQLLQSSFQQVQVVQGQGHAAPTSFHAGTDDRSEGSDPSSLAVVSMDGSEHSASDLMCSSSDVGSAESQRFKPFHEEKWSLRYKELLLFHKTNGHSAVPHTFPKNPQLARWVKRQRRQFKLRKEGRPSTMTAERLDLLNSVGFIWDSHDLNWREKLEALTAFRAEKGHCNVPSNFRDKKLATWVKCQRRQYKLYWDGKPSAMSLDRIAALEKVGFEWEIRSSGGTATAGTKNTAASAAPSLVTMDETESEPLPVHIPSTMGTGEQLFLAKAIASL